MTVTLRAATAAVLFTASALAAGAAPVTQSFDAEIVSQTGGPPNYVGVLGFGSVTYDDADSGLLSVDPSNFSLTLNFSGGAETFNGDPSDPFLQALIDADGGGGLNNIDFTQLDDDTFTPAIEDNIMAPGLVLFSISNVLFSSPGVITKVEIDADVEPIPLPGALPLMATAIGLAGIGLRRKRKA